MAFNLSLSTSTTMRKHLPAIFLMRHSLLGCLGSGRVKSGKSMADFTNSSVKGTGDSDFLL